MPEDQEASIFSGDEAFKVVAKVDGAWNWAMVAPDEQTLPLIGGGAGSVEEMKDCMVQHQAESSESNFFCLIRLTFGTGSLRRNKWAFIHLACFDEEAHDRRLEEAQAGATASREPGMHKGPRRPRKSMIMHAKEMGKRGTMEQTIKQYANVTASIQISDLDDLHDEYIVNRVREKSTVDSEDVDITKFRLALAEHQKRNPNLVKKPKKPKKATEQAVQAEARGEAEAEKATEQACAP
jgi:hypothetical protein